MKAIETLAQHKNCSYTDAERFLAEQQRSTKATQAWKESQAIKFYGSYALAQHRMIVLDLGLKDVPVPNEQLSAPTREQRLWLHNHGSHMKSKDIAKLFNCAVSSAQNVKNSPPPPVIDHQLMRPFTAADSAYIARYQQDASSKLLAEVYGVGVTIINLAKLNTTHNVPIVKKGVLSLIEKRVIRDHLYDAHAPMLAKEYHTSATNIRTAQRGEFSDNLPDNRQMHEFTVIQQLTALEIACTMLECSVHDLFDLEWQNENKPTDST